MKSPKFTLVRKTRTMLGLTTIEAAQLVHSSGRAWQYWETGDRKMPPAIWELFLIKIGLHPVFITKHQNSDKLA
jgi:putative transcriptional regulator